MTAHLFQHFLLGYPLPVLSEEGQASRTHLALDLTTLDPVCLRLGPDPGPRIMEFLEALHHRRDLELVRSPRSLSGGVHDERSFLVESWVTGAPLSALRSSTTRDPHVATQLAWSLIRGLADLHGQYLVHGDLHPDNVLVDRAGVLQIVGEFPAPLQAADRTLGEDAEVGRYAAPEVDSGGPLTRRSDVFALGLLIYEIFEGRRLLARHRRGGFPLDPTIQANIDRAIEDATRLPAQVRRVTFQCLRLVAEHRPADAGEVLHLLVQSGETIPTTETRRATLRPLARRALRYTARSWLPAPVSTLWPSRLLENAARIWRYAQAISRRDRGALARGYRAVVEALWLALAALGPDLEDEERAEVGVALFWLHRAVARWGSRTLTFLVEAVTRRILEEGDPLAMAIGASAPGPRWLEQLREQCLQRLGEKPHSNRPLLTLAILDRELEVPRGSLLGQMKARVLARAGLAEAALELQFDHSQDGETNPEDEGPGGSGPDGRSTVGLSDLLAALGQAHSLSRPPPAEGSDPPRQEDAPTVDVDLDSGVSSGVDLGDEEDFAVDLDGSNGELPLDRLGSSSGCESRPGASPGPLSRPGATSRPSSRPGSTPGTLSGPVTSRPTPQSSFSLAEEHADTLFSKGQTLLAEDRLEEATQVFQELVGAGLLQRAHYRGALAAELRRLLWRVVHPRAPQATRVLVQLWELCLQLHLDDLASLCELLLLRRRSDAPVEIMARRRPMSPHLLRACIRRAALRGERAALCGHRVALAELHLDMGELAGALRILQRVPPEERTPEHAQAWARMFQVAGPVADASSDFRRLACELAETRYADYVVQRLAAFLYEFPFFSPARMQLVEHGLANGIPRPTAHEGVIQAEILLLVERPEASRRLLRQILDLEPENDEAMLLLATLTRDIDDVPLDRALLRPHILARADAVQAAYNQAVRGLTGTPADVPLRELLIDLCRRLGENPAPHRLALGIAALESGDPDRARSLCTGALAEAPDPRPLAERLLVHPRIDEIFSRPELVRLARPTETVEA